ncbi:MAG TPA: hypothetical protein EYO33_19355 [Phycisphaerales bacterium]|nr:hypothetical protein [Phycisphaerales bacterium]
MGILIEFAEFFKSFEVNLWSCADSIQNWCPGYTVTRLTPLLKDLCYYPPLDDDNPSLCERT